ncbi:gamma-glutamyltransferase family protein [Terrihabitans rhizophilus]|uniref:Gamma-glutamyltransferase family protein n=1 Tax=Terrihabitans rhizophilus TaxID=3092662 RepID=A0ABU4RMR3_9HYPH|nr:gamma-glutamyltransferase family protein [Terrihabitans sp. PJ23]MDX6805886.1 gamma-glutamyltransferase family protein [Terrihabitans sp. PJ23]
MSVLARSTRGMVTSPHALVSEAGRRVLAEGGNAIEAAITMAAAIAVAYPHFCGIGGDTIWLVSDAEGDVLALTGIGQAARDLPQFDAAIPTRGPGSALTTACAVDSWAMAHDHSQSRWGGTRSFASLLEPAITLAADGIPLSASQAFWLDFRRHEVEGWHGFGNIFMPGGQPPITGETFRQPDLARSLEAIARHGAREFYEGELARRIAQGLAEAGSPITAADLAATRTRQEAPLSLDYRGLTLLAPPPPTQGITTLAIMGVLAELGFDGVEEGSAAYYHRLVEAVKQAFLDRGMIADPDFARVEIDRLLSPEQLAAKARAIDPDHALAWPQPFRTGDTVYLAAMDAEGRGVSMLQSTYYDWGSGVVAGDTGIIWQNRGAAFSTDAASSNLIAPGKRPFYTLNPGMALRDGRPHILYGTQGADGQPQTVASILTRLIDYGMDPLEALSRPRFLLGRTFSDSRDSLKIEEDVGEACVERLGQLRHEISVIPASSPLSGQAGIIHRDARGTITGAHDPRSDGCALGLES